MNRTRPAARSAEPRPDKRSAIGASLAWLLASACTLALFGGCSPQPESSDGPPATSVVHQASGAAPVARNNTWFLNENAPFSVPAASGVLANDTDAEGNTLTAVLDTNVTRGALTLAANGSFTYTPVRNYIGIDAFTYHAHDGTSASNIVTVTFRVVAANEAPIATADAFATPVDTALQVAAPGVLGNDAEPEGEVLHVERFDRVGAAGGTVVMAQSGGFTYTPTPNFNGLDTFTYRAGDPSRFVDNGQWVDAYASWGVSLGDLDGDGDLDAFVANFTGQPDRVLLNNGDGTFTDTGWALGNASTAAVSLGDLDGDGDLDAFVASYGNQGNRVWLNDGSGTFSDSGQSLGSSSSVGVSLGDLDGDGDLDAFVTNISSQANRVWLNNGAGIFSDSGQTVGVEGWDVALGDLDGDGDLDAFIANPNGQPNTVWRNNGSGVFSNTGQALGSAGSLRVSLGDLDGDGDLDAFVANDNGPDRVWLNNGAGIFAAGQAVGTSTSQDVGLADLDGDGDLDAYVANIGANRVWFNNGSGTFSAAGQFLGASESYGVGLGDLDGDGDLDAFVANNGAANRVWRNDGRGGFSDPGQALGSSRSYGVSLGDVDRDGDLDAFVANYGQASRVWLNNGSGGFSDSGQALGSSNCYDVSLGDLDGDGDLDAFIANGSGQADRVWLNNGSGIFSDAGQALGSSNSQGVDLGDLDGDGDLDAFVASSGANQVWRNNGSGVFSAWGQALGSSASWGVDLGDLDGDGDLDAFVANFGANRVWLNNGSGTFTDSGQALGSSNSRAVSLGDLDSDGDLDAFVANHSGQGNRVWLNNGSGTFSDAGQGLGSSNSVGVSVGDLDGDGDLDAFVANVGQPNRVWLNNGSGTFSDSGQTLGSSNSLGVSLGDLDGDGDLDAFVTNDGAANRVWLNAPTVSAPATVTVEVGNLSQPPFITSNGGGASASIVVAENQTAVTTVTATDPENGTLTYVIIGGADASKFSLHGATGALTFIAAPDFEAPTDVGANNTYLVTVRVTAVGGTDIQTISVTVTNVNEAPTVGAGGPYMVDEGAGVTLTASGSDPENDVLTYTWDLDGDGMYDDGTGQTVTFSGDDGPRVHVVEVRAQDPSGVSATATASVTIRNVAPTILTATFLPTTPGESATITFTASAVDPGNDVLTWSWSWDDGTANGAGASASHAYADDGAYSVTLTVTDEDGGLDTETVAVTVSNVSPSFRNANPPTQAPGAEYTYDADMIEPGTTDVLTWQLSASPAGMTVDPTATCGQTPTHNPPRCRRLRWTPTPAQRQQTTPFDVVLDVTDGDGGSVRRSWTIDANPVDTDHGGASDSYELAYGLNINDPADDVADPDGDGVLTRDECLAGTDPTLSNAPSAPTPYAPVNNALVASPVVTLIVDNATDPDGDALSYVFEVVDRASNTAVYSTSPAALVASGPSRSQTVITEDPDNLMVFEEDGRYLWHAAAFDGHVYGPVSTDGFFIFSLDDGVPTAPVAVSPIGVTSSLSPTLTVNNAVDPEEQPLLYTFELFTTETLDLASRLFLAEGIGQGAMTTAATVDVTLEEHTDYFWRARASDGHSSSPWSATATFQVDTAHVPLPSPALLAPSDGAELPSDAAITLTWTNVADPDGGAVTYGLDVRLQANPDTAVVSMEDVDAAEGDDTSVEVGVLDAGVYTWRVSAIAETNASRWSETWTFLVRTPDTGDDDDADAGMDSGTDAGTGMDVGPDADGPDADGLDVHPDAPDDSEGPSDAGGGISLANTTFGCATTPAAPLSTGDLVLALLGLVGLVAARRHVPGNRKGV